MAAGAAAAGGGGGLRAGGRPPDEARGEYWMCGAAPGSHVPSKYDEVQKQAWCNNCTVPGVPATCGVVSNTQPIQMVTHLAEHCPVLNRKNPDGSTNLKKTYWMGELAARKAATAASSAIQAQAGQRKLTDMPKGAKPPLDAGEIEYLHDSLALSMAQKGMSMNTVELASFRDFGMYGRPNYGARVFLSIEFLF